MRTWSAVPSLASPGILCSADEAKRYLLSLERRHSIAVDQGDLSARMIVHPVDAACRDEVAGLDDKVLHADSIRGKGTALNAKSPDGVLSGLQRKEDSAMGLASTPVAKFWRNAMPRVGLAIVHWGVNSPGSRQRPLQEIDC